MESIAVPSAVRDADTVSGALMEPEIDGCTIVGPELGVNDADNDASIVAIADGDAVLLEALVSV